MSLTLTYAHDQLSLKELRLANGKVAAATALVASCGTFGCHGQQQPPQPSPPQQQQRSNSRRNSKKGGKKPFGDGGGSNGGGSGGGEHG
jgi:uncharacterized membrane protein YgcG